MTILKPITLVLSIALILNACGSKEKQSINIETDSNSNIVLDGVWQMKRAQDVNAKGEAISLPSFDCSTWTSISIPSTIMGGLVESGNYPNPYFKENMLQIPSDSILQNWWLTRSFELPKGALSKNFTLNFEGINYKAAVFLNGQLIADTSEVLGAFNTYELLVKEHLVEGENQLAVLLTPPLVGAYSIGFVDWAPTPPDKNMGIWRGVNLKVSDEVELKDAFVYTSSLDTVNYSEAELTVTATLVNHSEADQMITLTGKIDTSTFTYEVRLSGKETRVLSLSSTEVKALHIEDPKLWWPVGYGEPNLYHADLSVNVGEKVSSSSSFDFGIRTVGDYKNKNGHRGYLINGKKILIKGAGWVDQLFLENTHAYDETQMQYVVDMNMNCVRFEGFWGKDHHLYELCDKYGLLAMVGFSCHWEWHDYIGTPCNESEYGCADESNEIELVASYWKDQITWMRNHPSVFVWVAGSDFLPHPELEKKLVASLKEIDPSRPYLGAAKWHTSEVTGKTGVKMEGPYDYVTPNYWYTDTMRGGAFGFNTETGPGPQPPVLSSLLKMYGNSLNFPIDSTWNFHHGRHAFGTMNKYMRAFNARYGASQTLNDFALMAQISSYEAIRPMFEAFRVNQPNTTGIIQWMLNSAWPETFWQQYDFYLQPTGAYYGTKTACKPIQSVYNYGNHSIYLVNDGLSNLDSVEISAQIFDAQSEQVFNFDTVIYNVNQGSHAISKLPALYKGTNFIFIQTEEKNEVIKNNYWLSSELDVIDPNYENSSWIYTPNIAFGDLTAIRKLGKVTLDISTKKADGAYTVTINNNSDKIAFGIEASLWKEEQAVTPVFWSDNYLVLAPNESREISVKFNKDLGKEPTVKIQGVNLISAQ